MMGPRFPSITMVGVDIGCLGGVATLAKSLCACLEDNSMYDFAYIPSVDQSSTFGKVSLFVKCLTRLRARLSELSHAPHIVHVHMADNASVLRSFVVLRLAHAYGAKVLIHVHCDLQVIYCASSSFMKSIIVRVIKECDGVIALGEYIRDFHALVGCASDSYYVLPNAVLCPVDNPFSAKASKVLFLGNVIEEKGVIELLDAFNAIKNEIPASVILDICGRDFLNVKDLIAERGLSDRVFFRGIISPNTEFFSHYALNVLPSYKEALPMSLLEASACGIPSVVSDAGSMSEVVESGKNGFVVGVRDVESLANRMKELLCDDSLRADMSASIFEKMKARYSLDTYVGKLGKIYEKTISV